MKKKCCLISGGWDSAACFFKIKNKTEYEYVFINYNQLYYENEYNAAKALLNEFKLELRVISLPLKTDQSRRNFYFINEIKRLGYNEIIIGSRNILPLFDRYKDSNWVSLKLYGYLMGIKIVMPITGWIKRWIINFVKSRYSDPLYNCYYNGNNIDSCKCVNCREMRSLN